MHLKARQDKLKIVIDYSDYITESKSDVLIFEEQ